MDNARSTDDIYAILKNEIISLAINPGEELSENSLCKRFGVSRTPIRTVLQRLENKGYVTITPYKGSFVTLLDYHVVDQNIYARVAIESMVLRDFIHQHTPAEREAVCFALARMEAEAQKQLAHSSDFNVYRFLDSDLAMHNVCFRAINKEALGTTLDRMDASYARFLTLDINAGNNVPDVLADHREMLDIIDTGAVERIEPLMRRHLYGNVRRLGPRLFTDFRSYFVENTLPL
ncbi:MAG: GntR family transcriptional regulator [Clostridiales bacterium]|nr:GntR family transcriptional regulator [Clostridiales bacterium]